MLREFKFVWHRLRYNLVKGSSFRVVDIIDTHLLTFTQFEVLSGITEGPVLQVVQLDMAGLVPEKKAG